MKKRFLIILAIFLLLLFSGVIISYFTSINKNESDTNPKINSQDPLPRPVIPGPPTPPAID